MKNKNKNKFIIASLMFTNLAFALECPIRKAAPPCPDSGVKIIDESYPTQAFVVSNMVKGRFMNKTNKVPENFAMNVIRSYDYENIPQIIFPFSDVKSFEEMKKNIANELRTQKISDDKITKILAQMTHAETESYTWQQDYFISQFDPKTGAPGLSRFESYDEKYPRAPQSTRALVSAGNKCDIVEKPSLPQSPDTIGSGEMGGNTQALPGGLCFVGDNQGASVTEKFCGDRKNVVQVNTSWQAVGHVDEIFKVIPTNYADGRPKECQFSLLAASPRKALELMALEKNKNNKTFSFDPKLTGDDLLKEKILKSKNRNLCNYLMNIHKNKVNTKKNNENRELKDKNAWYKVFILDAMAGASQFDEFSEENFGKVKLDDREYEYNKICAEEVGEMTNSEYLAQFNADPTAVKINRLVQESIDKDKIKIKESVLGRLPQCEKYFELTDVPDLFDGAKYNLVQNDDGSTSLATPGEVRSLFPNPTNSVVMNKTLLIPDSTNNTFNNFITEELAKKRIKTSYIDVWEFAHVLDGNMHCSSHSLNYCAPKE